MGEDLIILRHPKYTLFACEIPGVRMGEDLIILRHPKYILGHDLYLAHDYKDKQIATAMPMAIPTTTPMVIPIESIFILPGHQNSSSHVLIEI